MDEISPVPPPPSEPPASGGTPPPPAPPVYGGTPPPPVSPVSPLPFEQPGYPFFAAIYETTKLFLTRPRESFERSSPTATGRAFFYGCLLSFLFNFAASFYQFCFRTLMGKENLPAPWQTFMGEMSIPPIAAFAANVLLSPFIIPIGILIIAGLTHVCLLILGGAPAKFGGTLRAASYGQAPAVFGILPFCGFVVGGVWSLVLIVIGVSVIHRVSTGRAVAAVLLPSILCAACCGVGIFMAGFSHFFKP